MLHRLKCISLQLHLLGEMIRSEIKCFCFEKAVHIHEDFISITPYLLASGALSTTTGITLCHAKRSKLQLFPQNHTTSILPITQSTFPFSPLHSQKGNRLLGQSLSSLILNALHFIGLYNLENTS